jgi:hypothetical protein
MTMFHVQQITETNMRYVLDHLSAEDCAELRAAGVEANAWEVFSYGVNRANDSGCVMHGDTPVAIFGLGPHPSSLDAAVVWMVATPEFAAHPHAAALLSRDIVQRWKERYTKLTNCVHREHVRAIRWLRWLGFRVVDSEAIGPDSAFFLFDWSRDSV